MLGLNSVEKHSQLKVHYPLLGVLADKLTRSSGKSTGKFLNLAILPSFAAYRPKDSPQPKATSPNRKAGSPKS